MDLLDITLGAIYVVAGVAVLLTAKLIKDAFTPYRIDEQLSEKDNPAFGLVLAGYFIGVTAILLGATHGEDPLDISAWELASILFIDLAYALGGICALLVGRVILDRVALSRFDMSKEVLQDRNLGSATVEAGCFVATGLTIAGAVQGEGGGLVSALIFFLLGQLVLVLFTTVYQFAVPYDVHGEIENDNVAAGVALGLNLVAMGIILLKGTAGDLYSWQDKLVWFGIDVAAGIALLVSLRRVTDVLFLPGSTLSEEIVRDRNLNAAWLEGTLSVCVAAIIFFIF